MNLIVLFLSIMAGLTLALTTLIIMMTEIKNLQFGVRLFHTKGSVWFAWITAIAWLAAVILT